MTDKRAPGRYQDADGFHYVLPPNFNGNTDDYEDDLVTLKPGKLVTTDTEDETVIDNKPKAANKLHTRTAQFKIMER